MDDGELDLLETAVVLAGRQGRIEYWSPGATVLLGYPAEQMIGRAISDLVPEQFRSRHWAGWRAAWRAGHVPPGSPIKIPVVCADGEVRAWVSHLVGVHAPHGQLLAVAAVWSPSSPDDDGVRELS